MNTFLDFADCALHLIDVEKITDRSRLAAKGASAGGLLMGVGEQIINTCLSVGLTTCFSSGEYVSVAVQGSDRGCSLRGCDEHHVRSVHPAHCHGMGRGITTSSHSCLG